METIDTEKESSISKRASKTQTENKENPNSNLVQENNALPNTNSTIDTKAGVFPHCIVWSPIHPATWLFPFVGHMAIGDMEGNVYDFQVSYTIGKNHLLFGHATRYIQLDPKKCYDLPWNEAVNRAIEDYKQMEYNVTKNNCHDFVGRALNYMRYDNKSDYNQRNLLVYINLHGRYCSFIDFLISVFPFVAIIAAIVCAIVFLL